MIIEKVVVGLMQVNCYILGDEKTHEAIIIDPGEEVAKINKALKKLGLTAKCIVNTHGHADHIGANKALGLPIYIHRLEADFLTEPKLNLSASFGIAIKSNPAEHILEDGDEIRVGSIRLKVLHTPGHTPGSICLRTDGIVFTGDLLFFESVGRTDFQYGSWEQLIGSIRNKVLALTDDTKVYPGHGPESTVGNERARNPFLND